MKKKGKDGVMYISTETSSGVYRWIPNTKKTKPHKTSSLSLKKSTKTVLSGAKEYEIHDNGGRPFRVTVYPSKKKIEIYMNEWVDDGKKGHYVKGKKIYETSYHTLFIGDNDLPSHNGVVPKGIAPGNSILVHVSDSAYVYIGHLIYSFETRNKEKINHYYSPIGANDVPYPYAIGENYTYFFLDQTTLPNKVLDLSMDAYTQYYGHSVKKNIMTDRETYTKKVIVPAIKKLRSKKIESPHYS